MNQQIWVVLASLVTVAGAYVAAKVAGKSTVTAAKVAADQGVAAAKIASEEGAFVRATDIYKASSVENDARVARLQGELQKTLERVERLEQTATQQAEDLATARTEIHALRRSVAIYEGRVIQLEATLRSNGIEVPPWTMLPADADLLGIQGRGPDPNRPVRTEP